MYKELVIGIIIFMIFRLNWIRTHQYNRTKVKLENILPINLRGGLNFILDVFGQMFCKKENPLCRNCLLRDKCDYYMKNVKRNDKRIRETEKNNQYNECYNKTSYDFEYF
jgi:adenine-specific DNA glycosylase